MKRGTSPWRTAATAVFSLSVLHQQQLNQQSQGSSSLFACAVPADIPAEYIWESDRQDVIEQCEAETNCGGLVFDLVPPDELEDFDFDEEGRAPPFLKQRSPRDGEEEEPPHLGPKHTKTLDQLMREEAMGGTAPVGTSIQRHPEPAYSVRRMLSVPLYYNKDHPEVYVSKKPWLIQRGAVKIPASSLSSTVLRTAVDMDILEAREWCLQNTQCVAFSFPLQSERSLKLVDQVVFVSKIAGFEYGGDDSYMKRHHEDEEPAPDYVPTHEPDPEWVTHIVHDRSRLTNRLERNIDISEGKWAPHAKSPYRPCCTANATLPSIEELQAVDNLKRISCNISRADFYEQYEKPRIPVMLLGCTDDWPAKEKWKDIPTLLERFDNDTHWDSISQREMKWGEFKEFYKEAHEKKLGIRIFQKLNPGFPADILKQDYKIPLPFRGSDFYEKLPHFAKHHFPKDFGPLHYWIVGSYATGTGPHADPLTTDAWSTLVSGHKWWIIYPKVKHVLSEVETQCHRACSTSMTDFHVTGKRDEVSWYASVAKHANKFHYGNDQHAYFVLQNPGETIFLPFGMIHSVMNMDETIAITEKVASEANFEEVWREILVSGEEEDWPHMYYKILTKEQREMARRVLWPITREGVESLVSNEAMYVGSKNTGNYADEEEEEEEDGPTVLSDEEFQALSDEDKADYMAYREDYDKRRREREGEEGDEDPVVLDETEFADLSNEEKLEYREYCESFGDGWQSVMPYVAEYFGVDIPLDSR